MVSWNALLQLPPGRVEQRCNVSVSGLPALGHSADTPSTAAGSRARDFPGPGARHLADGTPAGAYHRRAHASGWGHPGTPRLFEPGSWNPVAKGAGPFYFPDGKAHFNVAPYAPPTEDVDAEYPLMLTTGRVVSMFLSGNQTRRIGPLVDQYPEPLVEMHPSLARRLGIADRDWVAVESRRGHVVLRALVVATIRPDIVFVPYHWAGARSINRVTISAQDPTSKIPEYKVCAVRLRRDSRAGAGPPALSLPQRLLRDQRGASDRRPAAPTAVADPARGARRGRLCHRGGAAHGMRTRLTHSQKASVATGINLIVTLMVILQLWLLTATMNAWLGGDSSVVWPAALASLGCFLVSLGLLRRVFLLERPGD